MRIKTDERRDAIIAAAAELFREMGYERASMAAIAARVGGSKTTLYGYFKSKEELFAAVMQAGVKERAQRMVALLAPPSEDVPALLEQFGLAYLDLVLSPEIVELSRLGIAEGANGALGPQLYAAGPGQGIRELADHFSAWSAEGRLKLADPLLAAHQFKALLEAGTLEPKLYGAEEVLERKAAVQAAVAVFLQTYSGQRS